MNELMNMCLDKEYMPHPWDEFLNSRKKCIIWMHKERHYDDAQISEALSMTEKQVYFIRTYYEDMLPSNKK